MSHKTEAKFDDLIYCFVWSVIGAMAGAKLLYLMIEMPHIIENWPSDAASQKMYLLAYAQGGFVFYGGLIGAFAGALLSIQYFKLDRTLHLSILVPALPLVHAFGRIGCLLVGCCHGRETSGLFHVVYRNSLYAPNGVPLLPIQGVEALGDLVIFAVLLTMILRHITRLEEQWIWVKYIASYGVLRFVLEFFRGDEVRGFVGYLSTSQVISIALIGGAFALYFYLKSKLKMNENG